MTSFQIKKKSDLSSENSYFKLQGFMGEATAGTTTDIDWKIPEERWLTGGEMLVSGGTFGDKTTVQIVDKDNILGMGANIVLLEPITDCYVTADRERQSAVDINYTALLVPNLYFRIKYTSTGASNVKCALNLYTHKPRA